MYINPLFFQDFIQKRTHPGPRIYKFWITCFKNGLQLDDRREGCPSLPAWWGMMFSHNTRTLRHNTSPTHSDFWEIAHKTRVRKFQKSVNRKCRSFSKTEISKMCIREGSFSNPELEKFQNWNIRYQMTKLKLWWHGIDTWWENSIPHYRSWLAQPSRWSSNFKPVL